MVWKSFFVADVNLLSTIIASIYILFFLPGSWTDAFDGISLKRHQERIVVMLDDVMRASRSVGYERR
jgi:hypothetical protein